MRTLNVTTTLHNIINTNASATDWHTIASATHTLAKGLDGYENIKARKEAKASMRQVAACVRILADDAASIALHTAKDSPLRVAIKEARKHRVDIIRNGSALYAAGVIEAAKECVAYMDKIVSSLESIKGREGMILPMHTCAAAA